MRKVFRVLQNLAGRDGLSVGAMKKWYSVSQHPAVVAGQLTPQEAVREFVRGFDDRGYGEVVLADFERYYEEARSRK